MGVVRVQAASGQNGDGTKKSISKSLDKTEFIWNADWQSEMRRIEREEERKKEAEAKVAAGQSGFLNFNRSMALDSMDLDVSDEKLLKTKSEVEDAAEAAVQAMQSSDTFSSGSKYNLEGWNYVPTRAEKKRWASEWEKAQRFSQGGTTMELQQKVKTEAAAELREEKRKTSIDDYNQLKTRLFLFTAAVGGGLTGFAYVWKGLDTGASLGVGALLSLLYLRLLSKGVDSMTGGGGGPSAPSILVPVLIFGIYKRWNQLYAEDFGVTAEIIPMLIGFFTYKVSTIIELFVTILGYEDDEPLDKPSSQNQGGNGSGFQLTMPPVEKKGE